MPNTAFPGIGHVALTVSDLQRSVDWYRRLFGTDPVLDEDTGPYHHVVWSLGGTLLGLHGHAEPDNAGPASERRPGLDHVAFGCESRSDLEKWAAHLDEIGVEHGGIIDAGYGSGLSFRDPDNIPLEFFCPPSAS